MALPEVLFTPLLRATLNDVAGSISGTVTYAVTPDEKPEYARLEAELDQDSSDVPLPEMETLTAGAIAAEDGTYTIYFLSPGTYGVTANATIDSVDYSSGPIPVPVTAGADVTDVNFSLQ